MIYRKARRNFKTHFTTRESDYRLETEIVISSSWKSFSVIWNSMKDCCIQFKNETKKKKTPKSREKSWKQENAPLENKEMAFLKPILFRKISKHSFAHSFRYTVWDEFAEKRTLQRAPKRNQSPCDQSFGSRENVHALDVVVPGTTHVYTLMRARVMRSKKLHRTHRSILAKRARNNSSHLFWTYCEEKKRFYLICIYTILH